MNLPNLQKECHRIAIEKGFWDKDRNDGELLMLICSELGECLEALRHGNPPSDHIPKYSGAEEELSDAMIRILDMAEARGYNLEKTIIAKMEFNETRERMHGKQF